ncbi:unnamed protein product [Fraxinus pennsylvanica]|uniref:Uncharacterized protein n=1 Tax=Fraxinus pennsylvanica TaxID=56036 RepID=A0AAD2AFW6_9LAMI|nr:unnamed protein product [Fraxinus pennsylvanica]
MDGFRHYFLDSMIQTSIIGRKKRFEDLSLSYLTNAENFVFEVKTKEDQFPFDYFSNYGNSILHDIQDGAAESAVKFMQRSYSSNSLENKQNFLFQIRFDIPFESQNLQNEMLNSRESSFSSGQMRRVYSTGDLQVSLLQ